MRAPTDTDTAREFADIVGESQLLTGERIGPDYHHDEALIGEPVAPRFVARPQTAEQVAALLAAATQAQIPVTARGSGTGLSAAARPCPDGLLISPTTRSRSCSPGPPWPTSTLPPPQKGWCTPSFPAS